MRCACGTCACALPRGRDTAPARVTVDDERSAPAVAVSTVPPVQHSESYRIYRYWHCNVRINAPMEGSLDSLLVREHWQPAAAVCAPNHVQPMLKFAGWQWATVGPAVSGDSLRVARPPVGDRGATEGMTTEQRAGGSCVVHAFYLVCNARDTSTCPCPFTVSPAGELSRY